MIYVHIPFCRSFCIYCDFYSVAVCAGKEDVGQPGRFQHYCEAVVREATLRRNEILDSVRLQGSPDTLYIGGGTPSVLPLDVFGTLVRGIGRDVYGDECHRYGEFTVEVNPDDVCRGGLQYLEGLLDLGVNRLSMGVQSFDDGMLKWMNRRHNAAGAVRAMDLIRRAGFRNLSIDLIFGISGLTDDVWWATVKDAISLAPEHISAYQLSVEEGSALAELERAGKYREADEVSCRRQYDILCEMLAAAGYRHYEISNFARPGYEAVHNSAYWKRLPYTGLGAGAHSAVAGADGVVNCRRWNPDDADGYAAPGGVEPGSEILSPEDIEVEEIMLALRTSAGICRSHLPEIVAGAMYWTGDLEPAPGDRLRIPESRFFVSDAIIRGIVECI
ncbi:MAG: radical SAM family heme chaperone HemW [Candidatus Cryptobacteroides sp.]